MTEEIDSRLREEDVASYLLDRGLVPRATTDQVTKLPGGVSSDVFAFAIKNGRQGLVVKQALAQLKVADTWRADPDRVLVEAAALELAGTIVPNGVPRILDIDPARQIIVMERAPTSYVTWKESLLHGDINANVADNLGKMLAAWHSSTFHDERVRAQFQDQKHFIDLRITPFYSVVAERHPDLAGAILELAARLRDASSCLVHGDYSPKNVLTNGEQVWVLDWEVAHFGDPIFDLAFMLAHLLAKSIHLPNFEPEFRTCARAFVTTYRSAARSELADLDETYLAAQTVAILLARVDGTSPVEYFNSSDQSRARMLAVSALTAPAPTVDLLWERL